MIEYLKFFLENTTKLLLRQLPLFLMLVVYATMPTFFMGGTATRLI